MEEDDICSRMEIGSEFGFFALLQKNYNSKKGF